MPRHTAELGQGPSSDLPFCLRPNRGPSAQSCCAFAHSLLLQGHWKGPLTALLIPLVVTLPSAEASARYLSKATAPSGAALCGQQAGATVLQAPRKATHTTQLGLEAEGKASPSL